MTADRPSPSARGPAPALIRAGSAVLPAVAAGPPPPQRRRSRSRWPQCLLATSVLLFDGRVSHHCKDYVHTLPQPLARGRPSARLPARRRGRRILVRTERRRSPNDCGIGGGLLALGGHARRLGG